MNPDYLRGAIKAFGGELFAYCLNVDESDIEAIQVDPSKCVGDSGVVLNEMVELLTRVKIEAAIRDLPLELIISDIGFYLDENGVQRSQFNRWRSQCGGDVPDFATGDDLIDVLAPAVSDVYPATIIFRHHSKVARIFLPTLDLRSSLALMTSFGEAVLADPLMSRLFPNITSAADITAGSFIVTGARAGGLQLSTMSSIVFRGAFSLFRLRQQVLPEELRAALIETVETLRRLAAGEEVSVPAWIGISNIAIPVEELDLPWGTLRPYPHPTQLEIVPPESRPSTTSDADGKSWILGAILETRFIAKLTVFAEYPSEDLDRVWASGRSLEFAKLDENFADTSLAAMLATEGDSLAGCRRLWTAIFDPFSFGSIFSFRVDPYPAVAFHIFSDSEAESMRYWSERLQSKPVKKLEIAQRRILSALAERMDPVDGFIDAVVAWESLFSGTDQGELSFRICAAMASLLHTGKVERLDEHKRLVKLYTKRSKVLHGAQEITPEEAVESRDYAVRAILNCIKKLLVEHPDLLLDADRSKKIILGM